MHRPNEGKLAALNAPVPGDLVQVRTRHWLVEESVAPRAAGEQTLVRLVGVDDDNSERRLAVLWERELDAKIAREAAFDRLGERGFDAPELFAGHLACLRWNAVTATDGRVLQAPFRAGIRLDAYQLEPLAKALQLPRVNLLIADDVGLGKTIEAGLVIRELMLRRRVDFLLVAAPPSLLLQWQDELERRFGLGTVIVDRAFVREFRRKRGFAADPWASHSRFLISHKLLGEEQYVAGLRELLGAFRPKSMLVLDEAHHAAPASGARFAIDSQFTRTVRDFAGRFEHRLFLTATPHNGHSNSFSALLEMLDPQRFCRGIKVRRADLEQIAVRRLKEDLRALGTDYGVFPERKVEQIDIDGLPEDAPELRLAALLDRYRELVEARTARLRGARARAARLVVATLQHRLLSSIAAFAATLERHRRALERRAATAGHALSATATRSLRHKLEPLGSDEAAQLELEIGEAPTAEILEDAVNRAEEELTRVAFGIEGPSGEELELLEAMSKIAEPARHQRDRRIEWILDWIDREACPGFRRDPEAARWGRERLLVFTEWEETRRWLEGHLRAAIERTDRADDRIACLTGATRPQERQRIQDAFNADPEHNPIRILICTDAAREGLNLQRHCRQLLHFDLPWNPARIEQRNGRIDRKLQPAPTVVCRYFFYRQRPEDRVLQALLRKTETIRRELGPLSAVLEERLASELETGFARSRIDALTRTIAELDVQGRQTIDEELEEPRERRLDRLRTRLAQLERQLEQSRRTVRFDGEQLRRVLDTSLECFFGIPGLQPGETEKSIDGRPIPLFRIDPSHPRIRADRRLQELLDGLRGEHGRGEPRPLAFTDTDKLGDGAVQLHLEHPLVRRLLSRFGSQGLVEHVLSRACLATARVARPRVVLLGRLQLFGPGAARLHEEILAVAADWLDPANRRPTLRPLGAETGERVLAELDGALAEAPELPDDAARERLRASLRRDVEELRPALEERARAAEERARERLRERAEAEAANLAKLLADLERRLARELESPLQLELDLLPAERRQREAERRAQEERRRRLAEEKQREPERIREQYRVVASRLEPVGIVYLWPAAP